MKSVIISVITFLLVLFIPFYAGCGENSGKGDDNPKQVKAADFSLLDLSGKPVKLSDYTGKVVLLDFWATWCPPCVKEIPHFNELAKEYGDKGLVVLGISTDSEGVTAVEKFQKERFPIDYPVAMVDQETFATYQSYLPKKEQGGIPFTFIIDSEGVIRDHFVGYRDKDVFVKAIKPLL